MNKNHLRAESEFYDKAYADNDSRRQKGFAWGSEPSQTLIDLIYWNNVVLGSGVRVLDAGCGDGRHIKYFRSCACDVVGIDISERAVELCQKGFSDDGKVQVFQRDLTTKGALGDLGQFDIVLGWSVLGHIRRKYEKAYVSNLISTLRDRGHLIAVEFDISLRGLFKNRDYRVRSGHYSRGFTVPSLCGCLQPLSMVDFREKVLEDNVNNYYFNGVLMVKSP